MFQSFLGVKRKQAIQMCPYTLIAPYTMRLSDFLELLQIGIRKCITISVKLDVPGDEKECLCFVFHFLFFFCENKN